MSARTDVERLAVALEHLDILHRHLERGALDDQLVADAVSMQLSAAIAAIHDGDPALGLRLFGPTWKHIWGMRNRLAHGYLTVDPLRVADTVHDDLPEFERTLRGEYARLTT